MRAPGPAPDDVIEEIVENLSPLKRGQTRAAVTEIVNRQLKVLRGLASPVGPPSKQKSPRSQWSLMDQISDQKENREHAKKLNKALQQVEEFLAKAPSVLAWSLFDPLPPMTFTDDHRFPLAQSMPYKSTEEMVRAHQERADPFTGELRRLRGVCARAIDPGFGTHPHYDNAKHLCARFALALMRELSNRKPTSEKDQPFRTIASLLFKALSGERRDLERECKAVLREPARLRTDPTPK